MARTTGPAGVSVSQKLFAVLDCFGEGQAGRVLTLSEISRATGLPLSTTRRLLIALTKWGGLERSANGSFQVGIRLWEIGSMAPIQRNLREAALASMQDLYVATNENVHLVVLDGMQALCIEKIYGRRAVPTETNVGERMPLHATASGKVLLAFSGPDLQRSIIELGLLPCTPHTLVQPGRLAANLANIKTTGLAYSKEERTFGIVSVASPLVSRDGQLRGSVAIVARVGSDLDRLGPAVRTAALTISRAI